ncbi:unnamed protein product, partial [marine sediment metagenome]
PTTKTKEIIIEIIIVMISEDFRRCLYCGWVL